METSLMTVVALAMLPAMGNFAGGVLAEVLQPSPTMLNRALHAAAGVILAVIAVEVMPAALQGAPAWLLALAFMAGGCAYLLIETGVAHWTAKRASNTGSGAWMVYIAVAADLLGDGLLIGASATVSSALALVLALGQVLADVPEGFAVIANFREKGLRKRKRLLLAASFALPVVGAAILAYFLLRGQSETLQLSCLVFVGGIYTLAAVEDMIGEAHEASDDTRWSAVSFLVGFALFLLISGGAG